MRWEIRSRNKTCQMCEKIFLEGDRYHCLLETAEDEFVRKDFCHDCWESTDPHQINRQEAISYWRGSIKAAPVAERREVIHRSTAEGLLRKYLHTRDEAEKNLCYILALMLERKKIFVHKDTLRKGDSQNRLLIYEHAGTQEAFVIEDPQLSLGKIEQVQRQVKQLLDAETALEPRDSKAEEAAEPTDELDEVTETKTTVAD